LSEWLKVMPVTRERRLEQIRQQLEEEITLVSDSFEMAKTYSRLGQDTERWLSRAEKLSRILARLESALANLRNDLRK
jgi:predicted  nucleic acid-binding Zn-ribbon protein